MILTLILLFYTLLIVIGENNNDYYYLSDETKIKISEGDYYYNAEFFDNTKIEVSDGDYYYNDARDNYSAVSDLPEIETEIEI